jgi:diacylglycerol kinase family enzyme
VSAAPPGWLVVGSTAAGSSGQDLIEAVAGRLAGTAPAEVAVTADPDELEDVLLRCGERVLVAVGGDGSAHVVVNALERTGLLHRTTVGFVPLGTANDFATNLGMSADPGEAGEQLIAGRRRTVDVIEALPHGAVEPELVVNAVHAGLGVIGAERATPMKPVLGPLAYPVGVATTAAVYRGRAVRLRVDGELVDVDGPLLAVAVANAPRLGGVELVPDACIDDGVIDVLAVPARPWSARVRAIKHVAGRDTESVEVVRGRSVELTGDVGELDADGEPMSGGRGCRFDVRPGALTVLAPGV